jgi:hypothetical protein
MGGLRGRERDDPIPLSISRSSPHPSLREYDSAVKNFLFCPAGRAPVVGWAVLLVRGPGFALRRCEEQARTLVEPRAGRREAAGVVQAVLSRVCSPPLEARDEEE